MQLTTFPRAADDVSAAAAHPLPPAAMASASEPPAVLQVSELFEIAGFAVFSKNDKIRSILSELPIGTRERVRTKLAALQDALRGHMDSAYWRSAVPHQVVDSSEGKAWVKAAHKVWDVRVMEIIYQEFENDTDRLILKFAPYAVRNGIMDDLIGNRPDIRNELKKAVLWHVKAGTFFAERLSRWNSKRANLARTWAMGDYEPVREVLGDLPPTYGALYPAHGSDGQHNVKSYVLQSWKVPPGGTYHTCVPLSTADVDSEMDRSTFPRPLLHWTEAAKKQAPSGYAWVPCASYMPLDSIYQHMVMEENTEGFPFRAISGGCKEYGLKKKAWAHQTPYKLVMTYGDKGPYFVGITDNKQKGKSRNSTSSSRIYVEEINKNAEDVEEEPEDLTGLVNNRHRRPLACWS